LFLSKALETGLWFADMIRGRQARLKE